MVSFKYLLRTSSSLASKICEPYSKILEGIRVTKFNSLIFMFDHINEPLSEQARLDLVWLLYSLKNL
jgi:hypothetical protein